MVNPKRVLLIKNEFMTIGDRYAFIDESVEEGTGYYYKVVSVNILGAESDPTNVFYIEIPKGNQIPEENIKIIKILPEI